MTEARDALRRALAKVEDGFPENETDTVLGSLAADGWVLARRQDAEDGAALRKFADEAPEDLNWVLAPLRGGGWEVAVGGTPVEPIYDERPNFHQADTVAAAARKAREALP